MILTRILAAAAFASAGLSLAACSTGGSMPPTSGSVEPSSVRKAVSYKALYSFEGNIKGKYDGEEPAAGLTVLKGTLYGETVNGGTSESGTVFSVTAAGKERVVDQLDEYAYPLGGLTAVKDTLYGVTQYDGSSDGTVFSWSKKRGHRVLHTFQGAPDDGAQPVAGLIMVNGAFYGTTQYGGSSTNCQYYEGGTCGTVFKVTKSGSETVLHNFQSYQQDDGAWPLAALTNLNGTLYGTTYRGGTALSSKGRSGSDCGTIFSVATTGTEKVLYTFNPYNSSYDPCHPPRGNLIAINGVLYGTTEDGGTYGYGTVFSLTTSGSEQVLHNFGYGCQSACADGATPDGGLIDVNGTLYGTTSGGGANDSGTVFSVSTSGAEQVLHSFGPTDAKDGRYPYGNLVDLNGILYGTTSYGGVHNYGTVFALTP